MVRLPALASLLLSLVVSSSVTSAPLAKDIDVNGVRLSYVEQGSGEPIIFVHGAFSDLRVWEPFREEVAKRYRFIAYTQRYFGTDPWPDDGRNFNIATHADELAKLITTLNAGPVHLVTRSRGGGVAMAAALKSPALVRTLTLHEPALLSVLPPDGAEGKAAREDRSKFTSAAIAANKAGDPVRTTRIFIEVGLSTGAGWVRPLAGGDAEYVARQRANRSAAVRRCAPAGHHVRCTEDLHPADAGHAWRENARLLQADQ